MRKIYVFGEVFFRPCHRISPLEQMAGFLFPVRNFSEASMICAGILRN